jgi:hypothetical protein
MLTGYKLRIPPDSILPLFCGDAIRLADYFLDDEIIDIYSNLAFSAIYISYIPVAVQIGLRAHSNMHHLSNQA